MGLTGAFLTCVCSICSGGYACGQGKEGCTGSDCRPAVEEVGQGQDFHHLPPPQDPQACSQAQVPPQVGSPRQQARPIPDHQVISSPCSLLISISVADIVVYYAKVISRLHFCSQPGIWKWDSKHAKPRKCRMRLENCKIRKSSYWQCRCAPAETFWCIECTNILRCLVDTYDTD